MAALFVATTTAAGLFAPQASAQVTFERLLNSSKEPQNWLMYSGDYAGHRFSALDEIKISTAASLVPKWAYQTMAGGKFETTPLVVDGILYGTGQDNRAFALDARSGRPIWQYQRALPAGESRAGDFGRQSFSWDARCACDRAGFQDRQRGLGYCGRGLSRRVQHH